MNPEIHAIARKLLLEGSFTNNIGLSDGKMGIAIFFFHYAQYTDNADYSNFALELVDEICDEISSNLSYNFKDGLSGVGWGILYLIQEGFIEADENEVLEEIDEFLMKQDFTKIKTNSLNTGLGGIVQYVTSRKTVKRTHLAEFVRSAGPRLDSCAKWSNYLNRTSPDKTNDAFLREMLSSTACENQDATNQKRTYGISKNGYAGIGLKLLFDME